MRQIADSIALPADFKAMIGEVNDFALEFKKLRVEATYFFREVAYFVVKELDGPMGNVKKRLDDLNTFFVRNMPQIAQKTAKALAGIVQVAMNLARGIQDVGRIFNWLFDGIPPGLKQVAAVFAVAGLAIMTGPFGMIAIAIGGLLLLLDDFYTYMRGGKSALGPMWEKLIELKGELLESGQVDKFKKSFEGVLKSINDVGDSLGDLLKLLTGTGAVADALKEIGKIGFESLILSLQAIKTAFDGIADAIRLINGLIQGNADKVIIDRGERAKQELQEQGKDVSGSNSFIEALQKSIQQLSDWRSWFNGELANRNKMMEGNVLKALTSFSGGSSQSSPQPWALGIPSSTTNNVSSAGDTHVTLNQTNNIQSTDPQAAASSVDSANRRLLVRGFRSAVQ
ncbi:hypothetical protein LJK88_20500 [Paenibacillus sp. P26]|nr:hypothetical protein LJK88_20500 [Paenibacillus sp. P26]